MTTQQAQRLKKRTVGRAPTPAVKVRLTDTLARNLPSPSTGYAIHWDEATEGFGLRVTANGARAWIAQRRDPKGKTVRMTLGRADGARSISVAAARRAQVDFSSDLQNGRNPVIERKAERAAEKAEQLTFEKALRQYVSDTRRAKDGKPLKQRTKDDYLAMIEPPGTTKAGRPTQSGLLWSIANRPIQRLTAQQLRDLYASLAARGERQQTYAMQVLRAVLRFFAVTIEGNPLDPGTARAQRVALAPSKGKPSPIPPERLGAWWRAASEQDSVSADQLRFMLLTGCRPGEAAGILVSDLDRKGERVTLRDTKNRRDHVLLLSKQAAALAHRHAKGKKADMPLFGVADAGKTIATINAAADTPGASPHKLRHTFASVAHGLMPMYTYWRLMNRAAAGDVDAAHYVGVSDKDLRAAWQTVADYIVNGSPPG